MRPICVKCARSMECTKNEFMVKDMAIDGSPSTYWYGDLFECQTCGAQIVTGFGAKIPKHPREIVNEAEKGALEFQH